MSIHNFVNVVIKLIGLYWLIPYTASIFQAVAYFTYNDYDGNNVVNFEGIFTFIYWTVVPLLMIFRSEWIIRIFDLTKGLDETSAFTFNNHTILKFGAIVIGGTLLVNQAPQLISILLFKLGRNASAYGSVSSFLTGMEKEEEKFTLLKSAIGVLIGIVLLTNFDRVAKWLNPREE
jgi:hypothetical protein